MNVRSSIFDRYTFREDLTYPNGLALERGLTKYFHFYNYGRKHQSLDYRTPAQWYIDGTKGKKNTIP
jgi:transposase InsO family protein